GIYVENMAIEPIHTMEDLQTLIELGQSRRVVGSTTMNEQSSRSHSILGIHIHQLDCEDTVGFSEQASTLYLIDLAGSERAGVINAANDELSNKRLKEGTSINLSLTSLGMVIKALVEKSDFVKKKCAAPFLKKELFCNDRKKKLKYLNK
ncbi:kinesin, partial [Reticulomyxa filosa]